MFSVILALEIRCFDSIFHLASLGEKYLSKQLILGLKSHKTLTARA